MVGNMSEERRFSVVREKSPMFKSALLATSRSSQDAQMRNNQYAKLFSNYVQLREAMKTFSGVTETPLMSTQYFNATVMSYVSSFAGYLSIERYMDNPSALLWFLDVIGVTDNRKVLPNLGAEDLSGITPRLSWSSALTEGTSAYNVSLGAKIIPGSVNIQLSKVGESPVEITDDRKGHLTAPAGILSVGNVTYTSGALAITLGSGWTIAATDKLSVVAFEDGPGTPETGGNSIYKNRFKYGNNNILVHTNPDMLVAETNLISLAQMNKTLGVDQSTLMAAKLQEMFTKVINKSLVSRVTGDYTGDSVDVDVRKATTGYQDYRSKLDDFSAAMVDVDTKLAQKSVKGVKATAYLVGTGVASQFRKLKQVGLFTDNVDSNYVNDLVGFYDGKIPVLRHTDLGENDGYAVHKTADGNLAPVIRGIYLPLTTTPAIGNYNNPTQLANGLFYQEGHQSVAPELVQKFTLQVD